MNLNLIIPVGDTRSFTEEQYLDLMNSIPDSAVYFGMTSRENDEALVIRNEADDYLVWFINTTFTTHGEDSVVDQVFVTCTDAQYTPHAALDSMCLQMKLDTEQLQEQCYEERHSTALPGDE